MPKIGEVAEESDRLTCRFCGRSRCIGPSDPKCYQTLQENAVIHFLTLYLHLQERKRLAETPKGVCQFQGGFANEQKTRRSSHDHRDFGSEASVFRTLRTGEVPTSAQSRSRAEPEAGGLPLSDSSR